MTRGSKNEEKKRKNMLNNYENFLQNLYFLYLLELRALQKAAPYLRKEMFYTGNPKEDEETRRAVADLVALIDKNLPEPFDESQMFRCGVSPSPFPSQRPRNICLDFIENWPEFENKSKIPISSEHAATIVKAFRLRRQLQRTLGNLNGAAIVKAFRLRRQLQWTLLLNQIFLCLNVFSLVCRKVFGYEEFCCKIGEMFKGNRAQAMQLKEEFRRHFWNVSRIMDCVGCDKCRLWGKLNVHGIGTALRILFADLPHEKTPNGSWRRFHLSRNDVVALFNSIGRFASSVKEVGMFRKLIGEKQ